MPTPAPVPDTPPAPPASVPRRAFLRRRIGPGTGVLAVPLAFVALGVAVPLGYLLVRALDADSSETVALVVRWRNARLLLNTVTLSVGVLAFTTVIAGPMAWWAARGGPWLRRTVTLAGVLPLAIPGYVMATALLGATGIGGLLSTLVGTPLPRPSGYWGSLLALGLTTAPYLFLNLRSALLGLDPALEEAGRSLGLRRREAVRTVVIPQLRPAYLAGSLLVVLHVLGDFGVVSLMRFETFSYAIYLQYAAAFDRVYAAWLALMLLGLTGALLWGESRLLRGRAFARTSSGAPRRAEPVRLGPWRWAAMAHVGTVALVGVVLPVATLFHWTFREADPATWARLGEAMVDSVGAAAPAAVLAAVLALAVAWVSVRRPSRGSRFLERVAYLGYATPPLAFALALVVFSLRAAPVLYQTLALLVGAYALHFLAEAIGPVRSALYQAPPRLEEAARALGRGPVRAFAETTLPLMRRGLGASAALVFLSALKELPLTYLLSPLGFESLAVGMWGAASESLFGVAAPYGLAIVGVSLALVALLLRSEAERP
ncbi:MAG: iron ABC transporter permease [Bacteroidota bacterium]